MINIVDKKKCCGCTACEAACHKKCIRMITDNEGFIYPEVDKKICVDCKICENVCPIINPPKVSSEINSYVVRDKRKNVVKQSTSGGVFTSMMEYVLKNNGIIYGVIADEKQIVRHIRIESADDDRIKKIPGSKYVRSDITGIYKQIKIDAEAGKLICFSGTPCQVAGLKNYLHKDYSNVILVDVVCRGNPSPLFWKKFVEYLESKYNSKITNVQFRSKTYGYHSGSMRVDFENGKKYVASVNANIFLKAFFKDLCSRPSCYDCAFKSEKRCSDLTLYDCWHAGELLRIKDDDKGYTNVIVHSKAGKDFLKNISEYLEIFEVDTEKAIKLDGIMVHNSVPWNEKREHFLDGLSETGDLENYCLRFFSINLKDKFIESMKKYVYFFK